MEPKPVKHARSPDYPTRSAVEPQRDLLHENLPTGWRLSKKLAGAAGLLVAAGLTGCGADTSTPPVQYPEPVVRQAGNWTRSIFEDPFVPVPAGLVPPRACVEGLMEVYIPFEDDFPAPEEVQPLDDPFAP